MPVVLDGDALWLVSQKPSVISGIDNLGDVAAFYSPKGAENKHKHSTFLYYCGSVQGEKRFFVATETLFFCNHVAK